MKSYKDDLVNYRLEQTDESLRAARLLLAEKMFRPSVNRSYYAMFYTALAVLSMKGFGSSKHAGVISLFDKEFVKQGIFDIELSKWFHEAFEVRQRVDYRELFPVSKERATQILKNAESFVSRVTAYIQSN
jgi:uncharacterized protein (UPF0332 family)